MPPFLLQEEEILPSAEIGFPVCYVSASQAHWEHSSLNKVIKDFCKIDPAIRRGSTDEINLLDLYIANEPVG